MRANSKISWTDDTLKKKTKLSRREIIAELRGEIRVYKRSYRERDGQVRDPGVLRTISALSQAIKIVKETHGRKL